MLFIGICTLPIAVESGTFLHFAGGRALAVVWNPSHA